MSNEHDNPTYVPTCTYVGTDNHNSQPVVIIEYVSDSVTSQK